MFQATWHEIVLLGRTKVLFSARQIGCWFSPLPLQTREKHVKHHDCVNLWIYGAWTCHGNLKLGLCITTDILHLSAGNRGQFPLKIHFFSVTESFCFASVSIVNSTFFHFWHLSSLSQIHMHTHAHTSTLSDCVVRTAVLPVWKCTLHPVCIQTSLPETK